jgi:fatty acid-binding protein DegV
MAVKIVTDSSADIPPELLKEFDITVVPLYVRFGNDVFKDKVDIYDQEFYKRLVSGEVFPATSSRPRLTSSRFTKNWQRMQTV